jgi:signal transduction histidine kinase
MIKSIESNFRVNRVFIFVIVFRWASLLPALFTLTVENKTILPPPAAFTIALLANLFVSIFNRLLNKMVIKYPAFLGVDILFSAFILAISGGSHSIYYLYAISPLLAGAFFFQVRGAFVAVLLFTPLYIFANMFNSQTPPDNIALATQLAGIWLIPVLFAYPSTLLKSINQATDELSAAHRQLEIIHDLTVLLQAAPDLISVQERVLGAVTTDLGFSKAIVALVDPALEEIGGWMVYPPEESFPQTKSLPLKSENGEVIKALLNRNSFISEKQTLIQDSQLNAWLSQNKWFVLPLYLREHPVGVLLVEESGLTKERESTLMTVANQAALALGTTILCIDRARRLAVETERNRIARDIHDTVAQSLFGIVYSLDACITMLPQQADDVKKELIELRSLANSAHDEVRRSIFDLWPSALTVELFMADLTNYVNSCCRPRSFSILFSSNGDFNSLSSGIRRTVYRMAQEALANSARHSGAQSARLCLSVTDEEVYLVVSDEGKGFDPSVALSRSLNREHFGLQGIQERARAMGGEFEIYSQPNAGARIIINLPIMNGHKHYA